MQQGCHDTMAESHYRGKPSTGTKVGLAAFAIDEHSIALLQYILEEAQEDKCSCIIFS